MITLNLQQFDTLARLVDMMRKTRDRNLDGVLEVRLIEKRADIVGHTGDVTVKLDGHEFTLKPYGGQR